MNFRLPQKARFMQHRKCVKIAPANRGISINPVNKGDQLAQPNFQFEKRQKELARKKKKEEKKQRKLNDKASLAPDQPGHPDDGSPSA